jgi:hypothetical protein
MTIKVGKNNTILSPRKPLWVVVVTATGNKCKCRLLIPTPCKLTGKQKGSFAAVPVAETANLEEYLYHSSEKDDNPLRTSQCSSTRDRVSDHS